MAKYITDLGVSMNDEDEKKFLEKHFKKLDVNLNIHKIPRVYLWYSEDNKKQPITRIQFSYNDSMAKSLGASGFMKLENNINTGKPGNEVFMWFIRGTTESHVPITEIDVTPDDAEKKFASGWERMSCNLDRSTIGFRAFLWVKREKPTYIKEMKVTDDSDNDEEYFRNGYIRVDESTNRSTPGKPVFLWYLPTTKEEGCYVTLQVSTNEEEEARYQNEGFLPVIPRVNLNKGNQGNKVYLWYKLDNPGQKSIQTIMLLSNKDLIKDYEKAGITVRLGNLNSGKGGSSFPATPLYLGYYN